MRLRQVVVAARDLDSAVADLTTVLGIRVGFNDPGVAEFGLVNAVMPVGDTFLEVVSPVSPSAPARRFLDRRGGDGGYMVMIQTSDLDADRRRAGELGVRVAWQIDLDDIRGTHLHPADVGGAILSLDQPEPAPSWRWGGPKWTDAVRTDITRAVTGVDLVSDDPESLASQWGRVLARPAERGDGDRFTITLIRACCASDAARARAPPASRPTRSPATASVWWRTRRPAACRRPRIRSPSRARCSGSRARHGPCGAWTHCSRGADCWARPAPH